ncbi:MAG: NADH-quinone oxidoreductase subunit NuoN [Candidatus Melainabacteria bacterium]|nr:NADH-quinone oxidoreductase subunit NuoN [Candidatus Melainabacteria bacterium]
MQEFFKFIVDQNLSLLAPELILVTTILVGLICSLSAKESDRQDTWWLALVGVLATFVCLLMHAFWLYAPAVTQSSQWLLKPVLFAAFQADLFSLSMRLMLSFGMLMVLLIARPFVQRQCHYVPGEFYIILLTALLGGMLLSGANDLVLGFVAFETLGIASYILVGFLRSDARSAEAAFKYLVYGTASTAVLLFGFSLLYGASGGFTRLDEIMVAIRQSPAFISAGSLNILYPVMSIMIFAGIAFKLSVAPFHLWTPDVYEGAPYPVTAFLSVLSKLAGFAFALRILMVIVGPEAWVSLLAAVSILSMLLGNTVAIFQNNVKRLLAYSTIAHAGYILLGLLVLTPESVGSLVYYLATYLLMNLGAFASVGYFYHLTGSDKVSDFAGLVKKRPILTFVFSIFLLSLAGIPITAGFFAKFFLFQSVIMATTEHLWLIIIALAASTISLYYYLNIIRLMVIAEPSDKVLLIDSEPRYMTDYQLLPNRLALAVTCAGTLLLGFFADPAIQLFTESSKALTFPGRQVGALPIQNPSPSSSMVVATTTAKHK